VKSFFIIHLLYISIIDRKGIRPYRLTLHGLKSNLRIDETFHLSHRGIYHLDSYVAPMRSNWRLLYGSFYDPTWLDR